MCTACNNQQNLSCNEARLAWSLDGSRIVGSLDKVPFIPLDIRPAIQQSESETSLKLSPDKRALVYRNERSFKQNTPGDFISISELLALATIDDLVGVGGLVEGGIASGTKANGKLELSFTVPTPIEDGEKAAGFLSYVKTPNDPSGHYRLIAPLVGASGDSILIGHADGSVEFSAPINAPELVPLANLTGGGHFSGAPTISGSGNWRYQQMGITGELVNTSTSKVHLTFSLRMSLQTGGSRQGAYATLVVDNSDFVDKFLEGANSVKQELGAGGMVSWSVVLDPGKKAKIKFGAWSNNTGDFTVTIGSIDESAPQISQPTITMRRIL